MYSNKRQTIKLSNACWSCLDAARDMMYANTFALFLSKQPSLVQSVIRKVAPDIKGYWLRFQYEGKTVTFSLSDEAFDQYGHVIQEFSSFGYAVRILGAYESYVREVVEAASKVIPNQIIKFKKNHKIRTTGFVEPKVGRGMTLFHEVFGYNPHPSYEPCLQFFFQLRNIAVHNSGIADNRLCNDANNPYVKVAGTLKPGDQVNWGFGLALQLQHLMTSMLPKFDPLICNALNLQETERQAWWYLDTE